MGIARKWVFPIIWMVVFAVIAGALVKIAFFPDAAEAEGSEFPTGQIIEPQVPAMLGTIRNDVVLDGTVNADAAVAAKATLAGEVVRVYAAAGQWVAADTKLVQIKALVLERRRFDVDQVGERHRRSGRHAVRVPRARRPDGQRGRGGRPGRTADLQRHGDAVARAAVPTAEQADRGRGAGRRRPRPVRLHGPHDHDPARGRRFRRRRRRRDRGHRWVDHDRALRRAGRRDSLLGPHGDGHDRGRNRRERAHRSAHRGRGCRSDRRRLLRAARRHHRAAPRHARDQRRRLGARSPRGSPRANWFCSSCRARRRSTRTCRAVRASRPTAASSSWRGAAR